VKFFAVYFTKEFKPGEHWNLEKAHPSDLKQHWRVGDLYSTGTVLGNLPDHLDAVELEGDENGQPIGKWNRETLRFEV
jgi:hypothetical protein